MSFITDIFGGGDQTTTRQPFDPAMAKKSLWELQQMQGDRGYFPGQQVADFSPEQMMGFGMGEDFATGGAADLYGKTAAAQGEFLDPGFMDPSTAPWMSNYIDAAIRPMTRQLNEQVLPAAGDQALAAGNYGGSRQGIAEGIAKRGYLDKVGDISSSMYGNLYGTNINARQNAMSMSPMIASMGMLPSNIMQQIGGQKTARGQNVIGAEKAKYDYNRDIEYNDIINLLNLNAGVGGTMTQEGQGPLSGMMGAGLMAGGMMMGNPMMAGGGMMNMNAPGGMDINKWLAS